MKINISPIWKKGFTATIVLLLSLGLFFTACNNNTSNDNNTDESKEVKKTADSNDSKKVQPEEAISDKKFLPNDSTLLTIAYLNETSDSKMVDIRFYEREAIYTIDKSDKIYTANVDVLRESLKKNVPVKLVSNPKTNAITNFIKASDIEVRAFNTGEGINSPKMKIRSAAPISIDLSKIDTSKFNRVDQQLRFPIFKLCNNVVPDYATLVSIFNYCASQGCNNPPPYTITNCIPFQYVRDGCYARAHKMRQMIMQKYGYCVEKVFSYSQPYPKRLAVKADKWGGCCVEWWYHVVPLLRLNVNFHGIIVQVCYVIDPGMFNTPVTLSTWLNAQKNTTCNPNATVTSYSIQPGTAYAPSGGGYSTDPNYIATEQILILYKNLHTCN